MKKKHIYIIDLPKKIPVFPLSEVILLPGGQLKLHIFENRYINMTEDCLTSNRILGMVQPKEKNKLFEIGCIGKIIQFSEVENNKFFIELKGVCRYKKVELAHAQGHRIGQGWRNGWKKKRSVRGLPKTQGH